MSQSPYQRLARTPSVRAKNVALALQSGLTIEQIAKRWARPQAVLDDVPFLTPGCAGYPPALLRLKVPPLRLFFRGRPPTEIPTARVGIVGSRKATSYGRGLAKRLGSLLSERGVAVLSGLALGIDSAAHRGVVDHPKSPGHPVGVLGHGWNHHYPRGNHWLRTQVKAQGTLLTEYPPDHAPARWTFPERNRIIAALCEHLVVVEAGPKSGSLYTAEFALDAGRTVWIVPNKPGYANSNGILNLLRDGANPLVDVGDFLDTVSPKPIGLEALRQAGIEVNEGQRRLLRALLEGETKATALAEAAGLDARCLAVQLGELELLGLVHRCPGGWEPLPGKLLSQLVKELLKVGTQL